MFHTRQHNFYHRVLLNIICSSCIAVNEPQNVGVIGIVQKQNNSVLQLINSMFRILQNIPTQGSIRDKSSMTHDNKNLYSLVVQLESSAFNIHITILFTKM